MNKGKWMACTSLGILLFSSNITALSVSQEEGVDFSDNQINNQLTDYTQLPILSRATTTEASVETTDSSTTSLVDSGESTDNNQTEPSGDALSDTETTADSVTEDSEEQATEPVEEPKDDSSADTTSKPEDDPKKEEQSKDILTGTWGTCEWTFDESTGELQITAGQLGNGDSSPWNTGVIKATAIQTIQFTNDLEHTGKVIFPEDSKYLFSGIPSEDPTIDTIILSNLTQFKGMELIDTSNVVKMSRLFYGCLNLRSIDTKYMDTHNVVNMSSLFASCISLTSLDVSSFDTSNVTNMSRMFYQCLILPTIDLTNMDTSKVKDMSQLFAECRNLVSLDLTNFDTSNVTNMSRMFANCVNLKQVNLSSFDTQNVSNLSGMFSYCQNLISIDLNNFDTSKVTDMNSLFYHCTNLKHIDLSHFNTQNVRDMKYMFYRCLKLSELDTSNFKGDKVRDTSFMFFQCSLLTDINLSQFKTPNLTTTYQMFSECKKLVTLDISQLLTNKVVDFSRMFNQCERLSKLDLSHFDTSSAQAMNSMFSSCSTLKELDVSHFDTSNVTTMSDMFAGCSNLVELDVSHFNTAKVTRMSEMFYKCVKLSTIDLSHFDTSNVTTMSGMFSDCLQLTTLDLSHFNTSKLTMMNDMFIECRKLETLDISSFDTSKVTDMRDLFYDCPSLKMLDLSHFDTRKVKKMDAIFYNCLSLEKLDLSHFDTTNVSTMENAFLNLKLKELTLGQNFKPVDNASAKLGFPVARDDDKLSGRWIKEGGASKGYTSDEFMLNYGTDDLTAGTYVAEKAPTVLESEFVFSNQPISISNEVHPTFTLKYQDQGNNLATTIFVDMQELPKTNIDFSDTCQIELIDSETGQVIKSSSKTIKENQLELPTFDTTQMYRITLSGTAWNNTSLEDTFKLKVNYEGPAYSSSHKVLQISEPYTVQSGTLAFHSVPEVLNFKKEQFDPFVRNKVLNRQQDDWAINITDLRGSHPLNDKQDAPRTDWEITAMAHPFTANQQTIDPGLLSMVFIQDDEVLPLSETDEILIGEHHVEGEVPKDHSEATLSWSKDSGFHAMIYRENALKPNAEYSAEINLELRQAP